MFDFFRARERRAKFLELFFGRFFFGFAFHRRERAIENLSKFADPRPLSVAAAVISTNRISQSGSKLNQRRGVLHVHVPHLAAGAQLSKLGGIGIWIGERHPGDEVVRRSITGAICKRRIPTLDHHAHGHRGQQDQSDAGKNVAAVQVCPDSLPRSREAIPGRLLARIACVLDYRKAW